LIYLLTAIGLTPGGSSTVHIYTQTIHRTTQSKQYIEQHNNLGKCGQYPVVASYLSVWESFYSLSSKCEFKNTWSDTCIPQLCLYGIVLN